jgi:AcrR family transcriptional regulator
MPRWPSDSRRLLIDAALASFSERGFAESTIEDIAQSAGVSRRTFFRHFSDKEEVLFADDDELLPLLISEILDDSGPVRADGHMRKALGVLAAILEPQRSALKQRQRVIDSQISLSGRELAKQALWQRRVADALVVRGFPSEQSEILAALGFALFRSSLVAWLASDGGPTLDDRIGEALTRVPTVLSVWSADQSKH